MPPKSFKQTYIGNVSTGLIQHALELLQTKAFPVYAKNNEISRPPFAHGEYSPAGIAVLLITTGMDHHLARLKFLRDCWPLSPSPPKLPIFSWKIGDPLSAKVEAIFARHRQKRLKEQLIEITAIRDSLAHPKMYMIEEELQGYDLSFGKSRAVLPPGVFHRDKTIKRKRSRSEHTKLLRLPLVPVWISYRDAIFTVMVFNRFLHWLERHHGSYGSLGGLQALNKTPGFFPDWGGLTRKSLSFGEWTIAFFSSLSTEDKKTVTNTLGGNLSKYL